MSGERYPPHFEPDRFPEQRVRLRSERFVFLQLEPREVLPGSGVIVPLEPRATPFDLTADEWAELRTVLHDARRLLEAEWSPDGWTIGWNVHPTGGQTIDQVHLHLIPRFADEPYAGRGLRWLLKQPENRRPGKTGRSSLGGPRRPKTHSGWTDATIPSGDGCISESHVRSSRSDGRPAAGSERLPDWIDAGFRRKRAC